jgi:hypothetical protein
MPVYLLCGFWMVRLLRRYQARRVRRVRRTSGTTTSRLSSHQLRPPLQEGEGATCSSTGVRNRGTADSRICLYPGQHENTDVNRQILLCESEVENQKEYFFTE